METAARSGEIVVGVDDSPYGLAALRWAYQEASGTGRTLHAVRAWSFDPRFDPRSVVAESAVQMRSMQGEQFDTMLRQVGTGTVEIRPELIEGHAAEVLVRVSKGAAMLVLGSHGRGRLLNALVGSITAQCLRKAACPVVVIPAHTVPDTAGTADPPTKAL